MNRTCLTFPAVKDFIRQRFRNFLNNCIQFYEPNISLIFYDDLDPWGADPAGLKYIICTIWLFVVNYFGFFIMKLKYAVILICKWISLPSDDKQSLYVSSQGGGWGFLNWSIFSFVDNIMSFGWEYIDVFWSNKDLQIHLSNISDLVESSRKSPLKSSFKFL